MAVVGGVGGLTAANLVLAGMILRGSWSESLSGSDCKASLYLADGEPPARLPALLRVE